MNDASNRFFLTFDTEWSAQEIIDDTVNQVKARNLKATFFLTDDFPEIKYENVELAQHPNIENKTVEETEAYLARLFERQKVTGIRTHKLYNSSILNMALKKFGISYQANIVMFLQEQIKPFIGLSGIIDIPVYFMDYYHLDFHKGCPEYSTLRDKILSDKGIKVFDFHPIEIYLNCPDLDYYYEHRDTLRVNTETYGIGDFFRDLLQDLDERNTFYMKELLDHPFEVTYKD